MPGNHCCQASVFPVYAGVIPYDKLQELKRPSVPRVCGGDPIKEFREWLADRCSPCMRG
nr:MAG TPA: hypothetical protein [Caudoviricetes sp.]